MNGLSCADCSGDTSPKTANYYMLKNSIWREISLNTPRILLCLRCARVRLGRGFTLDDFEITPKQMLLRMAEYWQIEAWKDALQDIDNIPEFPPELS